MSIPRSYTIQCRQPLCTQITHLAIGIAAMERHDGAGVASTRERLHDLKLRREKDDVAARGIGLWQMQMSA